VLYRSDKKKQNEKPPPTPMDAKGGYGPSRKSRPVRAMRPYSRWGRLDPPQAEVTKRQDLKDLKEDKENRGAMAEAAKPFNVKEVTPAEVANVLEEEIQNHWLLKLHEIIASYTPRWPYHELWNIDLTMNPDSRWHERRQVKSLLIVDTKTLLEHCGDWCQPWVAEEFKHLARECFIVSDGVVDVAQLLRNADINKEFHRVLAERLQRVRPLHEFRAVHHEVTNTQLWTLIESTDFLFDLCRDHAEAFQRSLLPKHEMESGEDEDSESGWSEDESESDERALVDEVE